MPVAPSPYLPFKTAERTFTPDRSHSPDLLCLGADLCRLHVVNSGGILSFNCSKLRFAPMTNEGQLAPQDPVPQETRGAAAADIQTTLPTAAAQLSDTTGLWERIQRHKVVEWTLAYVAAGFALVHGVEMGSHAFEWPRLVSKLAIVGWLAGIPVAATIAWYHGHRAQQRVSRAELSILVLLLFLVGGALWFFTRKGVEGEKPQIAVTQPITGNPANVAAAFAPPPHSVAVLPFVNMSGDTQQEYFSDGLTEEILNSLARINELQVSARTSSFSFKGKDADIGTIPHKLNVASILEGSVRRAGHTIRVTAQLNNAVTGYHLWSQTYDRDLGDVLKLQTDIANAVANALRVALLGNVAAKIEVGGTRDPAAFDAYLRASNAYRRFGPANLAAGALNKEGLQSAVAAYTEAIRADPDYALAYAGRSLAFADFARALVTGPDVGDYFNKAQSDARKAIALAPDLADSHLALANFFAGSLELADAFREYERALALAPGNATLLKD